MPVALALFNQKGNQKGNRIFTIFLVLPLLSCPFLFFLLFYCVRTSAIVFVAICQYIKNVSIFSSVGAIYHLCSIWAMCFYQRLRRNFFRCDRSKGKHNIPKWLNNQGYVWQRFRHTQRIRRTLTSLIHWRKHSHAYTHFDVSQHQHKYKQVLLQETFFLYAKHGFCFVFTRNIRKFR